MFASDRQVVVAGELLDSQSMAVESRRAGPGAPVPPTLVYTGALVAGWLLNTFVWLPIDRQGPTDAAVALGVLAVALGVGMFFWGMLTFAAERTGIMMQEPVRQLVTSGPYRFTRNPMYVGFGLGYLGLGLIINSAWILLLFPVVVLAVTRAVIPREEHYMRNLFGASYLDYCRRVPRWF